MHAAGNGIDTPTSPSASLGPRSPGAEARGNEFMTGYTLGLIGGVRSWVSLEEKFQFLCATANRDYADDQEPEKRT